METKEIPVLLLTGYLGSGKTTLLNNLLSNRKGIKFAVIVNDLGEVNIDADLIQKGGVVGGSGEDDLVALQNGCICCTLKMDLIKQVMQLVNSDKFDYIVIEASGICEPAPIAQTLCAIPQMAGANAKAVPVLDCIVTVVDALRLKSEFGLGDSLKQENIGEEDIENLIIEQIEFCNLILLNKISEVSPEEAAHIKAVVKAIQPKAEIIGCDYCDVPLNKLLDTHDFDFDKVAGSAAWVQELERPADEVELSYSRGEEDAHHHEDDDDHHHHEEEEHHHHEEEEHHHDHDHHEEEHHHHEHEEHEEDDEHHHGHHHHHHHHHDHDHGEADEYGVQTFVYFNRRPFNFEKFDHFLAKEWPKNIIRAKGVCYFSQNTDMSLLFEQAGVQKQLKEAGLWYATAPKDELLQLMMLEPGLARDWDPVYGDRMEKIVIIGQNLDRDEITRKLDACLD